MFSLLAACGGGGGGAAPPPPSTYTVGGTVMGLTGTLVLQNNGGDNLTISANGSFAFSTKLLSGAAYSVTVFSSTVPTQTCTVANGAGSVSNANVNNIAVVCNVESHTLGGTVAGLAAGSSVVLRTNTGDSKTISGNVSFTFDKSVARGTAYVVSVQSQPSSPPQYCTVTNGSGTVGSTDITDIQVACVTLTVGGTVRYLNGAGLVLQNNGGDDLPVSANGAFEFATPLASGATYNVTVKTPPSNPVQTCMVVNGSGTVNGASVTNIEVTCSPWTKQFGGAGIDEIRAVATDSAGNVVVAGYIGGDADYQMVVVKYAVNGAELWRKEPGVPAVQDQVHAVATDSDGNVYVAGYSNGNLGGTNSGGQDIVVVKYSALGTQQWIRQLGTGANDVAYGIAVDASALYVAGATGGDLDGAGSGGWAGGDDLFIAKYDLDGARQWIRQLGTGANDVAYGIAVGTGALYVVGSTGGDLGGAGSGAGGDDLFVVKYDLDGVPQWTRQLGTEFPDIGRGVAIAADGNVYVAGYTEGALFPGSTNAGGNDIFLIKYGADGTPLWTRQDGTAASEFVYAISTDSSGVYLAGFRGEQGDESLLAKYDPNGMPQWTQLLGSGVVPATDTDHAYGVAADGAGNVYVGGYTTGGLDGYVNSGGHDAFVAKYNSSGVKQ